MNRYFEIKYAVYRTERAAKGKSKHFVDFAQTVNVSLSTFFLTGICR